MKAGQINKKNKKNLAILFFETEELIFQQTVKLYYFTFSGSLVYINQTVNRFWLYPLIRHLL